MARCVMAVVGVAPCQCFSPGGIQITSPGRISSIGPPQRCARPHPAVTIKIWPNGWVCHAVLAPGSNVTLAPSARAGGFAWNRGSMRTAPVKYSAGPLLEVREPLFLMSIICIPFLDAFLFGHPSIPKRRYRLAHYCGSRFADLLLLTNPSFARAVPGSEILPP